MRKAVKKLRSRRGESFVEILIAILIVALGCAVIASMFAGALHLNNAAREKDDAYFQSVTDAEQPSGEGTRMPVEIEEEGGGKITVETESYDNGGLRSYRRGAAE